MGARQRTAQSVLKVAVAAVFAGTALVTAAQAGAEPVEPLPPPAPGAPAPVPPPVGPPPVPAMADPVYGQGQSGGQFGYLKDIWHAARSGDPVGALTGTPGNAPAPPPGAGPPPPLPPGFVSLSHPESNTGPAPAERSSAEPNQGGPALPEGYFPLSGPPPPGWYDTNNSSQPIFGPGAPPAPIFGPGAPPPPPAQ
ncbi:hypothetical protein [Mycolicibacterium mengxianglii]|uniref:hypothetical protein n=1 Tax=Mycolicibacterium mengxianglii TaxID=2736649 RepID=UPI0018D07FC3|nr:hypothetical protein [Mycolicibacterium mengxianglii]